MQSLRALALPEYPMSRAVDTLAMARKKFPGAQANLNALCRRFEIDNSHRDLHGALVDADLLTEVYIELLGGRQPDLSLDDARAEQQRYQPASETPSTSQASAFNVMLPSFPDPICRQS